MNYQSFQETYAPSFSPIPAGTPYKLPGAHEDVYRMLNAKNRASIGASRNQSLTDFENEKLAAQQNSALTGLQNLVQARKQQEDLANAQSGMRLGVVNSLLSGLFR